MKIKWIFLVILIFSEFCISQYKLKINTDSVKAVFINSNYFGLTPIDTILKSDVYHLKIIDVDQLKWNKSSIELDINLTKDTIINLSNNFTIKILTDPPNLGIYSNEELLGYSPLEITNNRLIQSDTLMVRINNKYLPIKIVDTALINRFIFEEPQNKTSFFSSTLLKMIGLTSSVILGGLSSYFKDRANHYYYNMPQDLARVKNYDNLSAVFSILLQVDFILMTYLLLSE